ncbi:MAG: choice-of-anchor J domain-containing protein, partial [Bergeyella zoohelcum]|nr:choice-of-anchor J domain-containing protein [Bergeyella zoohelcum]
MVFNDSTNDRAWEVDNFLGANYGANKSSYNAISFSWMDTPLTANHWLLSPKMNKGLELLQYSAYFPNPEKYDVYIVKAPTDGIKPTLEHIKAGKIVYSSDPSEKVTTFVNREIDISQHTQEDFYIAFHHKTTDQDNGL